MSNSDGKEDEFYDPPVLGVEIFGWAVHRVFRDDKKEMIKIVLHKDNEFKEFENVNWRKKNE